MVQGEAGASGSQWLNERIFKWHENLLTYTRQAAVFIRGKQGKLLSGNYQGKRQRKTANWPLPNGIAFNPYYGVLLGTRRLEEADKSDSNATGICISMPLWTKKWSECLEVAALGQGRGSGRAARVLSDGRSHRFAVIELLTAHLTGHMAQSLSSLAVEAVKLQLAMVRRKCTVNAFFLMSVNPW